jgi:hypothetical protein
MLARSHEHLNWHDDGALLKIASVLVDFGVSRGDLDALDRVLGQPSNLDEVTERIDLVEHVLGALPDDDSVPPGAIAQLLGVIQSAAPSLLQSVDAAAVQALLTGLLPVMLEHPDLPAYIESGLSVGMSLQNAIDWARQPQGQTPPNLQGALAYQRARVAAFGTADGASRARWQALGLRLQTDDAFRSRVRDLTLGLSPGLQRSLPLAQAVLFAEHAYSNDQIRVWLDSGTGVSDVLLTAPLQADQVQGPTRKLGSGAFNTVLAVRYGDDAASAREYAFKPLQASDKTGISLRCAGVRKGDPQVLARNMASAELARRLGMAGLIPDSRPGFYRNSQGELQLGVVMGLANSELADKKTRLREEDISDSSDAAGVYLQATAQLGGAHAMMYPGFEFKRIRQKQAAFDELRKRYPNLTQESDLQIREVNGARRLFATVSRYLVPDPAQADPALQEAVMGLQLLDYLLLQVDRHLSNFMIQRDATGATRGVVGFDNDQCLGTAAHPNQLLGLAPRLANGKMGPAHFLGRPPLLSEQQIQALQNFDAQDYRLWLEIAGFSPAVIAAFDYRLSTLRSEAQAAAALGAPAARADGLRKVTAFDEASRDWLLGHGRSLAQPGWLYDNPLWRLKRTTAFEKRAMVDYLRL